MLQREYREIIIPFFGTKLWGSSLQCLFIYKMGLVIYKQIKRRKKKQKRTEVEGNKLDKFALAIG